MAAPSGAIVLCPPPRRGLCWSCPRCMEQGLAGGTPGSAGCVGAPRSGRAVMIEVI